jgi:hypothetical protein
MSDEPIDDIELEEAEPVDGSFLDVSLVEEVNSNSQENYCCGVCNKVSDVKLGYRLFHGKCPGSATLDRFGMEHRREVFLIR